MVDVIEECYWRRNQLEDLKIEQEAIKNRLFVARGQKWHEKAVEYQEKLDDIRVTINEIRDYLRAHA